MYVKGDLRTITACVKDAEGDCVLFDENHKCWVPDSRGEGVPGDPYPELPVGTIYLPHSCSEWVIGGSEQIKDLIADLTIALEEAECKIVL